MSEWIPCNISKPPESQSVLLYVCFYHENGIDLRHDAIFTGFYGNEDYDEEGFYIESINDDDHDFALSDRLIKESNQVKVLAWTLLPRKPYNKSFTREEWSW